MLRAFLVVSSLAYYIGIKDLSTLALYPMLPLVFFCSSDLTPFVTAITLMINLTLKQETGGFSIQYLITQSVIIALGGTYEMVVLSDYGDRVDHGRSLMFWTGKALPEAAFRKGLTSAGKLLRSCRNIFCQSSLALVTVIDPLLTYFFPSESSKVIDALVKSFILLVPIVYTNCIMYEETFNLQLN